MSTHAVPVRDLEPYVGRHVSFVFYDGWDDWPVDGILLGLDQPGGWHLTYVLVCNCGDDPCDRVASEHGAVGMAADDIVRVDIGGRS